MGHHMRHAVVLICVVSMQLAARAADPPPALALADQIVSLKGAGDETGLAAAVRKAAEACKATKDPTARQRLLDELGRLIPEGKPHSFDACKALLDVGDPKVASGVLAKVMPDPTVQEVRKIDLAVVEAAGRVAGPLTIAPLLTIVEKAVSEELGLAAVHALGGYGEAEEATRASIVSRLLRVGRVPKREVESASPRDLDVVWVLGQLGTSAALGPLYDLMEGGKDVKLRETAARTLGNYSNDKANRRSVFLRLLADGKKWKAANDPRWKQLEPAVVEAMNTLAGEKQESFDAWVGIVKYQGGVGPQFGPPR